MADALTAAAAGTTAAAAASMQGLPQGTVLVAAIIGAGISVWLQHAKTFEPSRLWIAGAIGSMLVAIVAGVAIPEVVAAWAPTWELTKPAGKVPPFIVALAAATGSHFLLRIVGAFFREKSGMKGDSDAAR